MKAKSICKCGHILYDHCHLRIGYDCKLCGCKEFESSSPNNLSRNVRTQGGDLVNDSKSCGNFPKIVDDQLNSKSLLGDVSGTFSPVSFIPLTNDFRISRKCDLSELGNNDKSWFTESDLVSALNGLKQDMMKTRNQMQRERELYLINKWFPIGDE